jgi:hypothetical protein
VEKGFIQREGIDYNEIISSVSSKDSFIIIMTLVVHYDLKLYQMDVKTAFLNGNLYENVYMAQPKGFVVEGKENLRCHLTKSIYGLKQAFSQWYLKFDETIRKFGFKKMRKIIAFMLSLRMINLFFLVLYVDGILLASSDVHLLLETKGFLSSHFDIKDLSEASYVLGIQIHRDRRNEVLGLSQNSYIEKVFRKFNMHKCNHMPAPIVKDVKIGKFQCPWNQYEINEMKAIPYVSAIRSLMYA